MTYMRDGTEYLDDQEMAVYRAVQKLNAAGRSTNTSQVTTEVRWGRTTVSFVLQGLEGRGFLRDTSKSAACNWRTTAKKPPEEVR